MQSLNLQEIFHHERRPQRVPKTWFAVMIHVAVKQKYSHELLINDLISFSICQITWWRFSKLLSLDMLDVRWRCRGGNDLLWCCSTDDDDWDDCGEIVLTLQSCKRTMNFVVKKTQNVIKRTLNLEGRICWLLGVSLHGTVVRRRRCFLRQICGRILAAVSRPLHPLLRQFTPVVQAGGEPHSRTCPAHLWPLF